MLKKWSLNSFKSIYKETNLDLLPITIFTGANSSGKSSVIQSILLSAQTVQNNIESKSVILNGQIIRLGNFYDILSYNNSNEEISIGFDLEIDKENIQDSVIFFEEKEDDDDKKIISCNYSFSIENKDEYSTLHPVITKAELNLRSSKNLISTDAIKIKRSISTVDEKCKEHNLNNINERAMNGLKYDVEYIRRDKKNEDLSKPGLVNHRIKQKYIGSELNHFIPKNIVSVVNKREVDANNIIRFMTNPNYRMSQIIKYKEYLSDEFMEILIKVYLNPIFLQVQKDQIVNEEQREKLNQNLEQLKSEL